MSFLEGVLMKEAGPQVLLEMRKFKDLKKAELALKEASKSLNSDGIPTSFVDNLLNVNGEFIAFLSDKVDSNDVTRLLARGAKEVFVVCWRASESVFKRALRGELHLAMLSRRQVVREDTGFSRTVLKFLKEKGLGLQEFSETRGDPWELETDLMAELITLREAHHKHLREEGLQRLAGRLIDRLEEMVGGGADEFQMNEYLLALLQAYPVEVDERSGKPGQPDVIAYSPLWILFELKNEKATKQHVNQLKGYLLNFEGSSSTPLGIRWRGLLVASGFTPEVYAHAVKSGVSAITWEELLNFLREVFLGTVPVYVLREVAESLNPEGKLERLITEWKGKIELRKSILRMLKEGGTTREQIHLSLNGADHEDVDKALVELSGPVINAILERNGLIFPVEGNPLQRAKWALSYLGGIP